MRKLASFFVIAFLFYLVIGVNGACLGAIDKTYYVSSSMGNDSNDGLSEDRPKCHIKAIKEKSNVRIRLKRNDVFFEQLQDYKNCVFEAYGKGARPVMCGFKVLMNPQAWSYDTTYNCWILDMQNNQNFAGMLSGDIPEKYINNIGFIYNPHEDKIYGRRVKEFRDLNDDGSFFITNHYAKDSIKINTFRYLKWKIGVDPRGLSDLCFPMCLICIKKLTDCEVRNIAIVGFNFAIANCNGTRVENCQIDLIGGAVQIGQEQWVRYGNGIEFSANNKDNIIKGCLISRTYDCGVSIQSSGNFYCSPVNLIFTDNRFYHCRQAFEFFLNPENDTKPQYVGCSFSNNVCFMMGENEFSSHELRDANILSYDIIGRNIAIQGNSFWGASHFCGANYPLGMQGNTVYIYEGQYLSHYHFGRKYQSIYANNLNDIELYRQQSGDNSSITIMKKGTLETKRLEKRFMKKVRWKPVSLKLERLER